VRADRPPGVIIRSGGVYLRSVFVKINLMITHAAKAWHIFRRLAERKRTANFVLLDETGLSSVLS